MSRSAARMGKRGRMKRSARNRAWDCGIIQVMNRYRRLWRLSKERSSNRGPAGATVWSAGVLAIAVLAIAIAARLAWPQAANAQEDLPKPSEVVKIHTLKLGGALKPGATSQLEVAAEILPGWHINSNHPNSADFIRTTLSVTPPAAVKAGTVAYPPADEIAPAFSGGEKLSVFTGTLKFMVPLSAAANFKPDSGAEVAVTLEYQPCNDNICMPPAKVTANASLGSIQPASPPPHAALDRARLVAVAFGNNGGDSSDVTSDGSSGNSSGNSLEDGGPQVPGSELANIFLAHGMLIGLLAVLLGGLALNLTPCVYPLIGVTIAYFGNQGGGPRKIAVLAVIYVLGIALTFSLAGVAVALSGGLFGAALQNPLVLIAIAAMLLVLAASSFGMFSLQPPQWLMQRAGVARPGYLGSLVMGLGMGVVAAPCIGPIVLGLLLMVERSESPVFGFVLFFTLAIGLGLPYIALALAAGHIRALPRSGEWLAWIEQLFGFVLVGLALYFLDPVVRGWAMRIMPYYAAASRHLPGLHHSGGTPMASVPGLPQRTGGALAGRAGVDADVLRGQARRATRLRSVRRRRPQPGPRGKEAGGDRFQRRLVRPMPRDGAHDVPRSGGYRGGLALRPSPGRHHRSQQSQHATRPAVRDKRRTDDRLHRQARPDLKA